MNNSLSIFSVALLLSVTAVGVAIQGSTSTEGISATPLGTYNVDLSNVLATQHQANAILVDLRPLPAYQKIHIKDAVSIPYGSLKAVSPEILSKLKQASAVILYCNDAKCPTSRDATAEYHSIGLRHASYYTGGVKEWYAAGLPVEGNDAPNAK